MIFFAAAVVIVIVVFFFFQNYCLSVVVVCLFVYLFALVLSSVYPFPITKHICPCTMAKATLINIAYF